MKKITLLIMLLLFIPSILAIDTSNITITSPDEVLNGQNFTLIINNTLNDWSNFTNITVEFDSAVMTNLSTTSTNFSDGSQVFEINYTAIDNKITQINITFYNATDNVTITRNVTVYNDNCEQTYFTFKEGVIWKSISYTNYDTLGTSLRFYFNTTLLWDGVTPAYLYYNFEGLTASIYNATINSGISNYSGITSLSNKSFQIYNLSAKVIYSDLHVCYHHETLDLTDSLRYISLEGVYNGSPSCENLRGIKLVDTNSSDGNFTGLLDATITGLGDLVNNTQTSSITILGDNDTLVFENINCSIPKNYQINISYNQSQYNRSYQLNLYRPTCENTYVTISDANADIIQNNTFFNYSIGQPISWFEFVLATYYFEKITQVSEINNKSLSNNPEQLSEIGQSLFFLFNNESKAYDYNLTVNFTTTDGELLCRYPYARNESSDPNLTIEWINKPSSVYKGINYNFSFQITNSGYANVSVNATVSYNSNNLCNFSDVEIDINNSYNFSCNFYTTVLGTYLLTSEIIYTKLEDNTTYSGGNDYWVENLNETLSISSQTSSTVTTTSTNRDTIPATRTPIITTPAEETVQDTTTDDDIKTDEKPIITEQPAPVLSNEQKSSSSSNKNINNLISNKIRETQTTEYKDGKTIIKKTLKNGNILPQYDVIITVDIPKNIINSTRYIQGNYTIIKEDPVIQFYIQKIDSGKEATLDYTINKTLTQEEINQIITTINSSFSKSDINRLEQLANNTANNIQTKIDIKRDAENKTLFTTDIKPENDLTNVTVYLNIPKCLAEHLNELEFERQDYEIIEEDPLIAWSFDELNQPLALKFKTLKEVDEECWKQITVLPIADSIKEHLTKQTAWYYKFWPILIIISILIIGPLISKYSKIVKKDEHKDKHFLHKDILKELEFGFEETALAILIIINILDFFQVLAKYPDVAFAEKILSWTLVSVLLYQVSITKILFGQEHKKQDFLLIIGYFGLMLSDVINSLNIMQIEILEKHLASTVLPFINFILTHRSEILYGGFYVGLIIILLLTLIDFTKDIKAPSMMAVIHEEGKPSSAYKYLERFILVLLAYFTFFVVFFKFFIEWFSMAVDAAIAVIGIIVYLAMFIKKHHKHYDDEGFIYSMGTLGEEFYTKFIGFFSDKRMIVYGFTGMLVLHLLVDLSNYMIPYIFTIKDSLYYMQLANDGVLLNHTPLFELLKQILSSTGLVLSIKVILIYLMEFFAMILFLLMPAIIWYDLENDHELVPHRILNATFLSSITLFFLLPLFQLTPILGKQIVGIDLSLLNIFEVAPNFDQQFGIALVVFLTVFAMSFNKRLNKSLMIVGVMFSQIFFLGYTYSYLVSWSQFFTSSIKSLLLTKHFLIGATFFIFFAIILIFYIVGFMTYTYILITHWGKTKLQLHDKREKISMALIDYIEKIGDINTAAEKLRSAGWKEEHIHKAVVDSLKVEERMKKFIFLEHQRHMSKDEAKKMLLQVGWDKELVEDIFERYW